MEAAHPFFEPSVIGIHVVDVKIGHLRAGLARGRQDGIAALRAKATMAVPPSQQNWLAGVTTPPRAAVMDARFSLGNTASIVAPLARR